MEASESAEGALEPVRPSSSIREEIEDALRSDASLLGEVYRKTQAGESAEDIQLARDADNPNFVRSYRRDIDALLTGDLPMAPTVAARAARKFRVIMRGVSFTPQAQEVLRINLAVLELRAANETARAIEDKEAKDATRRAEAEANPGIYVYSLPHYLRHPFDEEANRTLFKIGHSSRSVIVRFRAQTRTTALPEDPVLLRIYSTDGSDSLSKEQQFHTLLEAADHDRSNARTGGREWFLTSLRFLDAIADAIGLETDRIGDLDLGSS